MAFFEASAGRAGAGFGGAAWAALVAPFRAFGNALVYLAENNSRMDQVRRLQAMSDEELAARGTNRVDQVRRIFASSGAI